MVSSMLCLLCLLFSVVDMDNLIGEQKWGKRAVYHFEKTNYKDMKWLRRKFSLNRGSGSWGKRNMIQFEEQSVKTGNTDMSWLHKSYSLDGSVNNWGKREKRNSNFMDWIQKRSSLNVEN